MIFFTWALILAIAIVLTIIAILWNWLLLFIGAWAAGPRVEYDEPTDSWVIVKNKGSLK